MDAQKAFRRGILALSLVAGAAVTGLIGCSGPQGQNSGGEGFQPSGGAASSNGILGGVAVSSAHPIARNVVSLLGMNADGQIYGCTATIIAENVALTAAHCVQDMHQGLLIFSTDMNTQDRNLIRSVSKAAMNPLYPQTMDKINKMYTDAQSKNEPAPDVNKVFDWGDIAMVIFSGGLPSGFEPVQVLTDPNLLQKGQHILLAGYGQTDGVKAVSSDSLRATVVTIENPRWGNSELSIDQTGGHGACHGDSGGPAFIKVGGKFVVVGVTSRGTKADCTDRGIYTTTAAYAGWIKENLALAAQIAAQEKQAAETQPVQPQPTEPAKATQPARAAQPSQVVSQKPNHLIH